MDPQERFSDRVADYVRYRPSYPRGVLNILRDVMAFSPSWTVADVGAGTGISTELLLDHGNVVVAVEPNVQMRAAAEERFGGHPKFRSAAGSAEETGLQNASVDLILAAQAFHWFDHARAHREFCRILRRPHWVALLWNLRRSDSSAFMTEYAELVQIFRVDRDPLNDEDRLLEAVRQFYSGMLQTFQLRNEQVLDLPGLRGRLMSSSYAPKPGHPNHAPMMSMLEDLFERHQAADTVTLVYNTDLYVGQLSQK